MSNASDFIIENGVLTKYIGPGGDVIIPEGVTEIGFESFAGSKKIKSVTISDSVVEIMSNAFCEGTKLEKVIIPGSVEIIGERAFAFCNKLHSVTISHGVKYIGVEAFAFCEKLKSITIPDSVEGRGNGGKTLYGLQFVGCGLEELTLPIGIEPSHGKNMVGSFSQCKALRKITIKPKAETSIKDQPALRMSMKDTFDRTPLEIVYAPECPIDKLSDLKPYAVLGYVEMLRNGIQIDNKIAATYEKYINTQRKKLYEPSMKNEVLLHHMIAHKIIPAEDIPELVPIADTQGAVQAKLQC